MDTALIRSAGLLILSSLCVCHGFYFQPTFLEPAYDQYGHEISRDRVLEIMDMKSTLLGYGLGFSFPTVPYSFRAVQNGKFTPVPRSKRAESSPSHRDPITQDILEHLSRIPLSLDGTTHAAHTKYHSGGSFHDFSSFFTHGTRGLPTGNKRPGCGPPQSIRCNPTSRYRTVDGVCNNLKNPRWGAVMQPLRRLHDFNFYSDGFNIPRMTSTVNPARLLPSARLVSRRVHTPDRRNQAVPELTNMITVWGQFSDHDITGTPAHKGPRGEELQCCRNVVLSAEKPTDPDVFRGGPCNPIYIPPGDRYFQYSCMNFARSEPVLRKRDCNPAAPPEVRQQMNMLTAYIDGSQVYGSSLKENAAIRLYRYGMLRVTPLDLLPNDKNATCVKDYQGDYCFRAGEMRVNEHPALTSMHTVFHRLHNQMAIALTRLNPRWDDEKVFQEVRKIMGAVMQYISYHDWLPIILGPQVMQQNGLNVRGLMDGPSTHSSNWYYDADANPGIINSFATAAFRFGHTLIPGRFTVGKDKVPLHVMFNRPHWILRDQGRSVGKFCSGLLHDSVQTYDRFITTELSDRLFEDKNNISMDLAALNIQRGRDHGLPPYNDYREACGLPRIRSFEEWRLQEPERAEVFSRAYDHVDDIDIFSGGISEPSLHGAVVGHTFACIIAKQMRNIKYGDRYWFESEERPLAFTPDQVREIRSFSLSRVLCTMAPLRETLVHPFYKDGTLLPQPIILTNGEVVIRNRYVPCNLLKTIDMRAWYDPKGGLKK